VRTTLTLVSDIAALLRDKAHRDRKPFKDVVNAALRRGLSPQSKRERPKPYRVAPQETKLAAGVDRARLNQLLDEMDEDSISPGGRAARRQSRRAS
jgi:hypothetical protein